MIAYTIIFFLSFTGDADGKVIGRAEAISMIARCRIPSFILLALVALGEIVAFSVLASKRSSQTSDDTSIPEQIEQLAKLKEQGILTEWIQFSIGG